MFALLINLTKLLELISPAKGNARRLFFKNMSAISGIHTWLGSVDFVWFSNKFLQTYFLCLSFVVVGENLDGLKTFQPLSRINSPTFRYDNFIFRLPSRLGCFNNCKRTSYWSLWYFFSNLWLSQNLNW